MYVTKENIKDVLKEIAACEAISLDTETTGLKHSDRTFSLQISTKVRDFYFNFNGNKDSQNKYAPVILNKADHATDITNALKKPKRIYIHDAKFDKNMLHKDYIYLYSNVYCTMSMFRVYKNDSMMVSLDAALKHFHFPAKNKKVEEYITKNKLYKTVQIPGKSQAKKEKNYHLVCHDLMYKYGLDDTRGCFALGERLYSELASHGKALFVSSNERRLVSTVSRMQRRGIRVSLPYIQAASQFETERIQRAKEEISEVAKKRYASGPKWLQAVFEENGYHYERTKTGQFSANKEAMERYDNPISRRIVRLRGFEKNLGTYYSSFLYFAEQEQETGYSIIRADVRQSATVTGRFSYREPNLQNVTKEAKGEYCIRKCFVPRKDHIFVAIDYDQQEYRLLLDRAGQMDLIGQIKEGLDVHQATANQMGVSRKNAKTLNFGILYGMGIAALAKALGVSDNEAYDLRRLYYDKLPKVKEWQWRAKTVLRQNKMVHNFAGRPLQDIPQARYKIANYLIQGGCGDIIKKAMNQIDDLITQQKLKTRMLLQVHDELLFEVPRNEINQILYIKQIMENAYPSKNGLPLTCSISHSEVSWSPRDMKDGEIGA